MMLEKAKGYALKYLSYRPRSVKEVEEYLAKKNIPTNIIKEVILYLSDLSYLDDEEFCRLWIKSRVSIKPMGKKRLYYELVQKGIAPSLIKKVFEETLSEEDELELAKDLLLSKKMRISDPDKLKRFLYRRGFDSLLIEKAFKEIFY